jgi:hypothetical protein
MPSPTPILGVTGGPPTSPGRLPSRAFTATGGGEGSGGGTGGLTPNPIRAGINIAFGSSMSDEAPLWQLLEDLGPT